MSVPPFALGLHLRMRLIVRNKPTKNPHSAKLWLAYIEQDGENLHAWGINGEMQNLNSATNPKQIYFGILMTILKNFFI